MRKFKTNLIASVAYQSTAIACGFVLPRLIIQSFGSEVNGLIQSITQFLGIITLLDMGLGQVTRSALYGPLSHRDNVQISKIMASGRKFYRRIAAFLAGYVLILMGVYPLLVDQSFDWIFTATMIGAIAVSSFSQYYFGIINEQLLHADQKSYLIYTVQIATSLINLIVCAVMIRLGYSIHAVKLASSLIFMCRPLFYAAYIHKKYTIDYKVSYSEEPIGQKWNGIAQHVSAVVLDGTDNIVLTLFSTLSNVSVYSVYYMVIGGVQSFYQAALVSIQSAAGMAWAQKDDCRIQQMFSSVELSLHSVVVFLFTCVGLLIVPFAQVYTESLTDADYIQPAFAFILALAYGIRCLRTPYNIWILAAGHFKQTQRCHIIAAVLNLVVSVLMVSQCGLLGVAIGTLIAMCYQTLWMTVYTVRNLVKCSATHVIKQYLFDTVAVSVSLIATSCIRLETVSYPGWIFMASKVAIVVLLCITCTSFLFYGKKHLVSCAKVWLG